VVEKQGRMERLASPTRDAEAAPKLLGEGEGGREREVAAVELSVHTQDSSRREHDSLPVL